MVFSPLLSVIFGSVGGAMVLERESPPKSIQGNAQKHAISHAHPRKNACEKICVFDFSECFQKRSPTRPRASHPENVTSTEMGMSIPHTLIPTHPQRVQENHVFTHKSKSKKNASIIGMKRFLRIESILFTMKVFSNSLSWLHCFVPIS